MSNKFKVGDKVIAKPYHARSQIGYRGRFDVIVGQVYTIKSITDWGNLRFEEKNTPAPGENQPPAHSAARFELAPEVPRDFRIQRNGSVQSSPYKTQESAIEAGRAAYGDNVEFEVVEVVVVSKNVVRKVVEARA